MGFFLLTLFVILSDVTFFLIVVKKRDEIIKLHPAL